MNDKRSLRSKPVAVIGYGSIGQRHVRNLVHLGYGVDVVSAHGHVPQNLANVIMLDHIDADSHAFAVIANRNGSHIPTAIQLASKGVHLLIEKPLSDTLDGTRDLVAIVQGNGITCRSAFVLRQHPCLRHAESLLSSGVYGKLFGAWTVLGSYLPNWRPGVDHASTTSAQAGVILDMAHEFDYLDRLLGPFIEVQAQAGAISDLRTVEDWSDILYRTPRAMGSLHLDFLSRKTERKTRITLETGSLVVDLIDHALTFENERGVSTLMRSDLDMNDLYLSMLRDFERDVMTGEGGTADLCSGIRTLHAALTCRESARTGKRIAI